MNTETKTHAVLSDEERVEIFLRSQKPKSGLIDDPEHIAFGVAPIDHDESDYENEISYNSYSDYETEDERKSNLRHKWVMGKIENISRQLLSLSEDKLSKLSSIIDAGKLDELLESYDPDFATVHSPEHKREKQVFPTAPPEGEVYARRSDKKETAPLFIERVYGRWLTGEFTRADLRRIDAQADTALYNWERTNGRAAINLPTIKERNDRLLANGDILSDDPTETARRAAAAVYRHKKHNL